MITLWKHVQQTTFKKVIVWNTWRIGGRCGLEVTRAHGDQKVRDLNLGWSLIFYFSTSIGDELDFEEHLILAVGKRTALKRSNLIEIEDVDLKWNREIMFIYSINEKLLL